MKAIQIQEKTYITKKGSGLMLWNEKPIYDEAVCMFVSETFAAFYLQQSLATKMFPTIYATIKEKEIYEISMKYKQI